MVGMEWVSHSLDPWLQEGAIPAPPPAFGVGLPSLTPTQESHSLVACTVNKGPER